MNRSSIESLTYLLLRQVSTNTDVSEANMHVLVNEAYTQVMHDLNPDIMSASQMISVGSTTFTSYTSATRKLVVANSALFTANTYITIYDTAGKYETVRIESISLDPALVIKAPGILTTFATGAIVVPTSFVLSTAREIKAVRFRYLSSAKITMSDPLLMVSDKDVYKYETNQDTTGIPSRYAILSENELWIYPLASSAGYLEVFYVENTVYTLSAAESVPTFGAENHILLVYWLMAHVRLRQENYQGYQAMMNIYYQKLQRANSDAIAKFAPAQPYAMERTSVEDE